MNCPLCLNSKAGDLGISVRGHLLFNCSQCHLHFKDSSVWPDWLEQKKIYDLHENFIEDKRYLNYLEKTLSPLRKFITTQDVGLDFGCGPSQGTEYLLKKKDIECYSYDAIYYDNKSLLEKKYNFIIANEVVEHLQSPKNEFDRFDFMLKDKGVLTIRTELVPCTLDTWWYLNDPSHIVFYSQETLNYIARHYKLTIIYQQGPVCIFRR